MHTAYSTSVKPAAKNCSASYSVDTVIPLAPASRCRRATSMHFVVLTCGRRRTPSASMRCCMRAILRIMRGSAISAAGVGMSDGYKPTPSIKIFPARPQRRDITLQSGRDQLRYLAGGELIGVGQIDAHRLHLPSQAGIGNGQAERVVQALDDRRGRAFGSEQGVPCANVHVAIAIAC